MLAKGGNTSNLLIHLKRHHPKQYVELIQTQEKKKSKEKCSKVTEGQTKLKAVDQSIAKSYQNSSLGFINQFVKIEYIFKLKKYES